MGTEDTEITRKLVTCNTCPFMIHGEVVCPVSGIPYRMPSMLCTKNDGKVIVDPEEKPNFCPLPLELRWGEVID